MKTLIDKCFREERFDEIKKLLTGNEDFESKVLLARTHNHLDEYQEAYALLQLDTHTDESLFQLMFACNGLNQFEESIQLFDLFKEKTIDVYLIGIVAYLGTKQYEKVLQIVEEALKLDEKVSVLNYYLYYTYTQLQQFKKAQEAALKAYQLEENLFHLRNLLSASIIVDDFDTVLTYYQDVDHPELKWFYFIALTQTNQHEKAVAFGEKLLSTNPELYYLSDGLAHNYVQLKQFEKVIEHASKYEEASDEALRLRSLDTIRYAYTQLGNDEKTKEYLDKLAQYADENLETYTKAEQLYAEGKFEEIVPLLQGIETPTAYRQLAATYYQLNRFKEAASLSKKLLSIQQDVEVRKIAVLSFLNANESESAKQELLKMESDEVALDFVYAHLSTIFVEEKNLEEAIHYAFLACESDPSLFENYARLSQLYSMSQQDAQALEALLNAEKLVRDDFQKEWTIKNLGVIYYRMNQPEKAYASLKSVNYLKQDELWVSYHMALACMQIGNFGQAIECLEFLMQQKEYSDEIVFRLALCYIETKQNTKFTNIYELCEQLAEKSEENAQTFEYINERAFRTGE